ncbi:Actin-like protein arp9 (SWI/SNF complex component arp9) [Neurospora sp. IMI 360204]|nr:Actin-like protein arp9 (SWI/SNF complex component arp9) [Neurospora sp. IMI 360204]
MSGQTGKWREEQVLVICPGSSTTMAQLGCGELSPPAHRFPTRMFRDEETGQWRPYHTYKRKKAAAVTAPVAEGEQKPEEPKPEGERKEEDEWEYVEDQDSDEGAVYPIQGGHIVVMDAFLAFLEHVHSSLTTTYHNTPIMLMASPQWTRPDCETLARYIFEKTKTPALCLINSAIATQYGLKWPNMTVVDIGFEKVDVTCIYDSRIVAHRDVGAGWPGNSAEEEREISGGEVFTRRLQQLLKDKMKGFNREMAEQLKMSNICEVLPYAPDKPKLMDLPTEDVPTVVAATTGAAAAAAASGTTTEGPKVVEPVTDEPTYDADGNLVDDEGVLDVANIVATGQTREFLAKKEKEKQEKAKKKGKDKEAEANRVMRLPNSKRVKNIFHFEEYVTEEVPIVQPAPPAPAPATAEGAKDVEMADAPAPPAEGAEKKDEAKTEEQKPDASATDDKKPEEKPSEPAPAPTTEVPKAPEPAAAPAPPAPEGPVLTERQTKRIRRDIEVGLERFEFADRAEIDRIVTAIYNAVQSIDDMYMRPPCWESLVFVGNGARIRGLKENILQTLQARHLISPSSATMFTSELPSNIGTPTAGTPGPGALTPITSGPGAQSGSLLQAATTAAANANLNVPGAQGFQGGEGQLGQHHFHSQTPTNIKLAQLPTYLSEWTKNGFEEAMFLGAQVAARMAFCIHNFDAQGLEMQRYMSLSRVDYK